VERLDAYVKGAPLYDAVVQLDRRQESRIYEYYGRPGYWESEQ
jgi:hypothetical protein